MQLNLSLTLKGWVALVFKSLSPLHSRLAPHRYPAAGERDAGAARAVGHGEPLHPCHVLPKEPHPGQESLQEGMGTAGVWGLGEGCCSGCAGGLWGFPHLPVSRQAILTLLNLTGPLTLRLREQPSGLEHYDWI